MSTEIQYTTKQSLWHFLFFLKNLNLGKFIDDSSSTNHREGRFYHFTESTFHCKFKKSQRNVYVYARLYITTVPVASTFINDQE